MGLIAAGCDEKAGDSTSSAPLFRSHFAGMTHILNGTNASKLKEIWSLPASQAVGKQALDKIANAPFQLWQKSLPSGSQTNASLIRPLLDDLISSESFLEINGSSAKYDSVIAIELDEQRARLWNTNLWQIITGWKLLTPKPLAGGLDGWETHRNGISVQFQKVNNWVLIEWSLGQLKSIRSMVNSAGKSGRPVPSLSPALLEVDIDFPNLTRYEAASARFKIPSSKFVILPHRDGESLRTEGVFSLAEPGKWEFEPWQIPTNQISDPLVSFTVMRGIDPLLKAIPGFIELGLKKTPTQVSGWSQRQGSFQSFWAFPSAGASNAVRDVAPRLQSFVKDFVPKPIGTLVYATNRSQVVWQGLPLIVPSLGAISDREEDYLLAGLFPVVQRTKPPPRELFAQIEGRKDLLYYDWEITADRVGNAKLLYQILDMINLRTLLQTNAPSVQWVDQAGTRLGNTVTEITAASPRELKLVRKSHIGLTGFEVATLLRWIDSSAFPLGYKPPLTLREAREQKMGRPAAEPATKTLKANEPPKHP